MERVWNFLFWLHGRLWLIPALMSVAAAILVYVLLGPGAEMFQDFTETWWLYSGGAGTARDLLSTLLAGMITMTSLVVSITVVVLSLAANQLGPRLIYNFIEDRRIQVVIGLFVSTILYMLLALRTIGDDLGEGAAVPHVAITVASILTIACLFALLYHVNLIAHSIVSDTIVRDVANSLDRAVGKLPEGPPKQPGAPDATAWRHRTSGSVGKSGYVQFVDYEGLHGLTREHDLLVVLHVRGGHFVLHGTDHFDIRSHEPVEEEVMRAIAKTIAVGPGRTPTQDLEYSVRQLVEIALRALSPSLNDPFTAIAVINRLAAALEIVSGRALPAKEHRDENGRLRVVAEVSDYDGLMDTAFNQIRQSAEGKTAVLISLARRLSDLLVVCGAAEQRRAVVRHLEMIERAAHTIPEPHDREDLLRVIAGARAQHSQPSVSSGSRPIRSAS